MVLVDIPSIFNKPDFLGVLLPGYIGIILTVVLFFPELAPVKQGEGISLDFFSAVVFLVAGPAVGYTLRQLHRTLYTVLTIRKAKRSTRVEAVEQYYALRIAVTDSEKTEVDMSEGQYDFNISTGIILIIVAIYFSIKYAIILEWRPLFMIGMGIVLFLAGYLERRDYLLLLKQLVVKYSLSVAIFYKVATPGNAIATMKSGSYIRLGEEAFTSSSVLVGKKLKSWKIRLRKTGKPSGPITAKIRQSPGDNISATFIESIESSLLSNTFELYAFTLTTPYAIKPGDRIMIEYNGPGAVEVEVWNEDKFDGTNTRPVTFDGTNYGSGPWEVTGFMSSR